MEKENHQMGPPLINRIQYRQGETIIKQGDFGISIYYIVRGRVEILLENGPEEIRLATLEAGEIMGEMTFLTGDRMPRSASARALLQTEVEAWHPALISQQYQEMPYVIKYMASQLIRRVLRMNRMTVEIKRMKESRKAAQPTGTWQEKRRHFRKKVSLECIYWPVGETAESRMTGKIRDISRRGLQLEIGQVNTYRYSHDPGDQFRTSTFLPNGKRLDVDLKIVRSRPAPKKGILRLGTLYVNPTETAQKNIGFFLMP